MGPKWTYSRFWRKFRGIIDTLDDYLDGFGGWGKRKGIEERGVREGASVSGFNLLVYGTAVVCVCVFFFKVI